MYYHVKYGSVQSKVGHCNGRQQNLDCPAPERGEIKVWRPVVLGLVLLLVLVFDLSLLTLEMKYGPPLRMVEGGRAIERAQKEGKKDYACQRLQTQPPTQAPMEGNVEYDNWIFKLKFVAHFDLMFFPSNINLTSNNEKSGRSRNFIKFCIYFVITLAEKRALFENFKKSYKCYKVINYR